MTINPGQDSPFQPVALQTGDIPGLRKILDECKRLREEFGMPNDGSQSSILLTASSPSGSSAAETEDDYDFEPFGWVGPYIADNVLPPLRTCAALTHVRTQR